MRSRSVPACAVGWLGVLALCGGMEFSARAAAPQKLDEGRELFQREWARNDDRAHGGDGLGPVYNDTSCVACHNAGGVGGAGPASKNVDIITATPNLMPVVQAQSSMPRGFLVGAVRGLIGLEEPMTPAAPAKPRKPDTRELIKSHAGFRTARSVVLHRFGDDPDYEQSRHDLLGLNQLGMPSITVMGVGVAARASVELERVKSQIQFKQFATQAQVGEFALLRSQRNPTALFGAGLIDTIPVSALEAAAKVKHKDFPDVAGRVSRQKDGRIGRFGWKAQTPSLDDFVLTACAVELGLEVPGHHQGGLPRKPEQKAKGLDLTAEECGSLVAYVGSLPRPVEAATRSTVQRDEIAAGKVLFAKVGCAACHAAKLGDVEGIYSDLLLHDMGPELGDVGQYGVFDPNSSEGDFVDPEGGDTVLAPPVPVLDVPDSARPVEAPAVDVVVAETEVVAAGGTPPAAEVVQAPRIAFLVDPPQMVVPPSGMVVAAPNGIAKRPATGPATRQEWRTPPLWGFRDSGPYLHDGRADTLDQAVSFHGGEGTASAHKFFGLSTKERRQVETFLKSLVAPDAAR